MLMHIQSAAVVFEGETRQALKVAIKDVIREMIAEAETGESDALVEFERDVAITYLKRLYGFRTAIGPVSGSAATK
jgi:hypothetical protein